MDVEEQVDDSKLVDIKVQSNCFDQCIQKHITKLGRYHVHE